MYIYIYILLGNGYHIQGPLPIGPITLGPIFWGRLFVGVGAATAAIARQLLQQFFLVRVAQGISLGVSPIVLSACIVVVLCLSQNDSLQRIVLTCPQQSLQKAVAIRVWRVT